MIQPPVKIVTTVLNLFAISLLNGHKWLQRLEKQIRVPLLIVRHVTWNSTLNSDSLQQSLARHVIRRIDTQTFKDRGRNIDVTWG